MPGQPDRLTHVTLSTEIVLRPTRGGRAWCRQSHALLNLWQTLKDGDAVAEAIDDVAVEYAPDRQDTRELNCLTKMAMCVSAPKIVSR